MTNDPLDAFVRSAVPGEPVSDERLDMVIARTLAQLDHQPRTAPVWLAIRRLLRAAAPRYAVQVATALLFGALLGSTLPQPGETVDQPPLLSLISTSAPFQPLGF